LWNLYYYTNIYTFNVFIDFINKTVVFQIKVYYILYYTLCFLEYILNACCRLYYYKDTNHENILRYEDKIEQSVHVTQKINLK